MIHLKDNPIGIDVPIAKCQQMLNTNLSWNDVDIYGRLYINSKSGGKIIEAYKDNKEYVEAFVDDTRAKIGFLVNGTRKGNNGNVAELNILCSADVMKIYSKETREDEAAMMEVLKYVEMTGGFKVLGIKSGNVQAVFGDFMETRPILYRDMQPFVNFSIQCRVNYFNNICNFT